MVSPVIRPLNHTTSPYAWNRTMRSVIRPQGKTYYKDNGQVLEDRVDWYREVLLWTNKSGTGNWRGRYVLTRLLEPVYMTMTRKVLTGSHAFASCMLKSRNEMNPNFLIVITLAIQTILCNESKRKVILNWLPDTTNYAGVNRLIWNIHGLHTLFTTVMRIEARQ